MNRILFICPFLPAKNANQAGHRLAYEYIKIMATDSIVDVILLIKGEKGEPHDLKSLANVNIVLYEKISLPLIAWSAIRRPKLFSFLTRYSNKIKSSITQIVRKNNYDIINLEFTQVFYHLSYLKTETNADFHLSAHDILTQSHLRKKGFKSYLSNWTFRAENELFNQATKIFVLSNKDMNLVHSLFGNHLDVALRPLPLPDYIYQVKRSSSTIEPQSLMFWGAMNRAENELSIINFMDTIFIPDLLKRYPMLKLYIVGSNPTAKLKKYESDAVIITGFVENPTVFFEKASIGIIPLLYGAGVKLKTLEMLETGMPVISTPIGVEGISLTDIQNISVTELDGFSAAICKLLDSQKK